MNREVIVTCAVTGAGDSVGKHPAIPVSPEQIAEAAIEAAKAGAAIAHCHVREPDGTPSRRSELYAEVVERIRSSGTDVVVNAATGTLRATDSTLTLGGNWANAGAIEVTDSTLQFIAEVESHVEERTQPAH